MTCTANTCTYGFLFTTLNIFRWVDESISKYGDYSVCNSSVTQLKCVCIHYINACKAFWFPAMHQKSCGYFLSDIYLMESKPEFVGSKLTPPLRGESAKGERVTFFAVSRSFTVLWNQNGNYETEAVHRVHLEAILRLLITSHDLLYQMEFALLPRNSRCWSGEKSYIVNIYKWGRMSKTGGEPMSKPAIT